MTLVTLESGNGTESIVQTAVNLSTAFIMLGSSFNYLVQQTAGLDEIIEILIIPDPSVVNYLSLVISAPNGVDEDLFENPTATGGTPISPLNFNRESPETTNADALTGPTITDDGLSLIHIGSADKKDLFASSSFVLMDRTKPYLLRLKSLAAANDLDIVVTVTNGQQGS